MYFFAGKKRKGDLKTFLTRLGAKAGRNVQTREIDILRGGRRHNLLVKSTRLRFLESISNGDFSAVVASPPCSTFMGKVLRGRRPPPLEIEAVSTRTSLAERRCKENG